MRNSVERDLAHRETKGGFWWGCHDTQLESLPSPNPPSNGSASKISILFPKPRSMGLRDKLEQGEENTIILCTFLFQGMKHSYSMGGIFC